MSSIKWRPVELPSKDYQCPTCDGALTEIQYLTATRWLARYCAKCGWAKFATDFQRGVA